MERAESSRPRRIVQGALTSIRGPAHSAAFDAARGSWRVIGHVDPRRRLPWPLEARGVRGGREPGPSCRATPPTASTTCSCDGWNRGGNEVTPNHRFELERCPGLRRGGGQNGSPNAYGSYSVQRTASVPVDEAFGTPTRWPVLHPGEGLAVATDIPKKPAVRRPVDGNWWC